MSHMSKFTPIDTINSECEQGLLGILLTNAPSLKDVIDVTEPEHFSDPFHAEVFRCIHHLHGEGKLFDLITVPPLVSNGEADINEKRKYLVSLGEAFASVLNARDYAMHLRDLYNERMMQGVMRDPTRSGREKAEIISILMRESDGKESEDYIPLGQALLNTVNGVEIAYRAGGDITGIRTGIRDLDECLCGFDPGGLYVIAGRPAMGKTALGVTIAVNASWKKNNIMFFSLEMSSEQICHRLIARHTGIASNIIKRGSFECNDFMPVMAAQKAMSELPITIVDKAGLTAERICALATSAKQKPDMIIIDHLGIVAARDPSTPRVYQVAEMTARFKALAKDLKCPVVLLHQLNRGVEGRDDKRPSLSDLRDSGAIEQDADAVMLLYRAEYYLRNEIERRENESHEAYETRVINREQQRRDVLGKAELIVAKNRQGEPRTVHMKFDAIRQTFSDVGAQ